MAGAVADDEKLEEIAPTPELKRPISKLVSQRLDVRNLSFKAWLGLSAVLVIGVGAICVVLWGSGMDFPASWGPSIGARVDSWVDWLKVNEATAWVLNQIKELLLRVMVNLEDALLWIPWPAAVLAVALVAWRVSGPVLAATSGLALVAIGVMGRLPGNPDSMWATAMETVALITVSVFVSLLMGIPLGVLAASNRFVDNIMRPVLDAAQTMPSFVYLVPALLFFGLGTVPAVMATVIYAIPPVIRLTNLGIRQVSPQTVEAARSFGATPMQLLVKVQVPMAIPTIMAGVNQTTMLALSMVVIATLVGAGGLGETVYRALGRQESGNALIGGLAIVAIAITIDRITQALTRSRERALSGGDH